MSVLSTIGQGIGTFFKDIVSPIVDVFNTGKQMSIDQQNINLAKEQNQINKWYAEKQNEYNLMNFGLQKENLEYQKNLQNQIFAREDNSVQRRVQDLKAAGLSPTLAAGSSAGVGSVVATQAPQVGRLERQQINMLNNLNTLNAMTNLTSTMLQNKVNAYNFAKSIEYGMRTTDTLPTLGKEVEFAFNKGSKIASNIMQGAVKSVFNVPGIKELAESISSSNVGNPLTKEGLKTRLQRYQERKGR